MTTDRLEEWRRRLEESKEDGWTMRVYDAAREAMPLLLAVALAAGEYRQCDRIVRQAENRYGATKSEYTARAEAALALDAALAAIDQSRGEGSK